MLQILLLSLVSVSVASNNNKNITLRTAIYPTIPFAYRDDANNGTWTGFSIELASILQNEALKDNYTLTFVGDANSVIEDGDHLADGDTSLNMIYPDICGENCYDIILGIYLQTAERAASATFLPPFIPEYLTAIIRADNAYNTLEEITKNNGTTCITELWREYSGFDTDIVCQDQGECYTMLRDGRCDLFAAFKFLAGYRSTRYPELFTDFEITGEVLTVVSWMALPTNMALPPETSVMLSKWMYDAYADGSLGDLQGKYFGYRDDDFPSYFPKQMSVTSGVYRNKPAAFQQEDGEWVGIVFDSADAIISKAKDDGIDLTIDIDISTNGVVSGLEGELGTPTGSLQTIASDCNGTICHDIILGAYTITPKRSELATFLPPYRFSYLTVISQGKFGVKTIEDANSAQAPVCLWEGSWSYDVVGPSIANLISCETQTKCYEMVMNGNCVLMVDSIGSALAQVDEYTGLYVTKDAVPGTMEYLAFPMNTSLDPTIKVALTLFQHEATAGVNLALAGSEYFNMTEYVPPSPTPTSGAGELLQAKLWLVGTCVGLSFIVFYCHNF